MTNPPQKSDSEPTEEIQVSAAQILRSMEEYDEDDDPEEETWAEEQARERLLSLLGRR